MNQGLRNAVAALAALGIVAAAGCSASNEGLSRQEVREVVRDELAAIADGGPDDAVSRAEMDLAIAEALAGAPVEVPVGDVGQSTETSNDSGDSAPDPPAAQAVPSKTEPAEYTKHVVAEAIERYNAEGLDAVVEHHNRVESVDGQWYVFVADEHGRIISHFVPDRRGARLDSWVGVDANGYQFGLEMLAANEQGRWVSYVYRNPETGDINKGVTGDSQLKNAWVVRHDGLLFGSGWYVDTDELIETLVAQSAELFLASEDLDAYLEQLSGSGSITSATASTVAYYNNSGFEGQWMGFIADSSGTVISAFDNPPLEGLDIVDVLGTSVRGVDAAGAWLTEADNDPGTGPISMRVWVMQRDGHYFGAGWYDPQSN